LLADVTLSWEAASTFMLSGSNLILHLAGRGTAADANVVWAVDVNGTGAVGLRRSEDNSTAVVALDNRLYWVTDSDNTNQLVSCPLASCTTANYTTVATRQVESASSLSSDSLVADQAAHELVWREVAYSDPVYTSSVVRSGSQGPARVVTSVPSKSLERWVVSNNRSDRYFWSAYDSATGTSKYYYLPTNTPSASPVAITGSMAISGFPTILASDTVAFIVTYPYPSHQVFSIPLPNGVAGEPPSVYTGEAVWAAADAQYAYGQDTGAATDGVWRCLATNCNPTYLARNFLQGSSYIIVDDKVLYVLDRASGGASFKVWKLAK
jgi:hypothetical protein